MAEKSIIVIGAGLAGLATGVYAQMNGYQSHIFEHDSKPGGVAAAWRRGDYLIDGGIHFLMGHKPGQPIYDLYHELGTAPASSLVDMTSYGRFLDEVSGRDVVITQDLERLARELKAISPDDARFIDDLIAGARAMQGSGALFDVGMGEPPELAGPLGQLKMMWGMRKVFTYFSGKYAQPMSDYVQAVHDPWLRQFIVNLFLPEVPAWFVFMVLALMADGQMGLLAEGCPGFVRPIEQRYQALGGQVTYHATVEEILIEDSPLPVSGRGQGGGPRAVGVRLADGSEQRADVVVSAADGYSTIFKLLGGRYVDEKTKERYRTWKLIRPTVVISFGVARTFPDEPHFITVMLQDPLVVGHQKIEGLMIRIFNYSPHFAPPGKTVVQVMFETEWDYWNDLQKDRPHYEAEKERVAAEVLARLERHFPAITSQVEVTDVATPYTTWRYTLNYKGAYMGWLPTPQTIMTAIPRTLPGLANFYLAGQWVLPGGGVPPCLYSGRHVVQILCRRDGKPFTTLAP
jgi:phytoene dehydrogenase-like protein